MTQVVPLPSDYTAPTPEDFVEVGVLFEGAAPGVDAIIAATQAAGLGGTQIEGQHGPACGTAINGLSCVLYPNQGRMLDIEPLYRLAARTNLFWPESGQVVDRYQSVVMIVVQAQDTSNFDPYELRGIAHALAGAVCRLPGALAVGWHAGPTLTRPAQWAEAVGPVFDGQVPTSMWFGTLLSALPDGGAAVTTIGLEGFGAADFELVNSEADVPAQVAVVQSALYDTVARLRQNRTDVPRPGDTVSGRDGTSATVVGLLPAQGHADGLEMGEVYQLRFRNDQAIEQLLRPAAPGTAQPTQSAQPAQPAPSASEWTGPVPAATEPSTPAEPHRGLVLLAGPIDLTQVAHELQQRGFEINRVEGPKLEAHAGAFTVTLDGYPGLVPDSMWTVQPAQQVCLGNNNPASACYVFVQVSGRDGAHGEDKHQELALKHTLATVAARPQALAVVLEHDTNATPPQSFVQANA